MKSGMATKRKLWNIPFADNRYFTGRETILDDLHRILQTQHKVALTGLGGIGKTQTAVHYVYQHQDAYQALLWLDGSNKVVLADSFSGLAPLLGFPDAKEQATNIVKNWLATNQHYCLIIDNADDTLEHVDSLLPPNPQSDILITTRTHSAAPFAQSVTISKMDVTESIKLLQ
jgi:RecA/RadA recombinase